MTERSIVHVVVRGRVQGVGYRAWVQEGAECRGLAGWVRNRRDGSVEAVFSGASETVEAMIAACREGPRSATVETIDRQDGAGDLHGHTDRFAVLPTV